MDNRWNNKAVFLSLFLKSIKKENKGQRWLVEELLDIELEFGQVSVLNHLKSPYLESANIAILRAILSYIPGWACIEYIYVQKHKYLPTYLHI